VTTAKLPLLVCTNGTPQSQPALDYGVWLAGQLKSSVRLLGILETKPRETALNQALSKARASLGEMNISYDLVLQRGGLETLIPDQTANQEILAVCGPLGRPAWMRTLYGRSVRRILRNMTAPLLYTQSAPNKMENILLCVGGTEHSLAMVRLALTLAGKAKPQVTLLHIVRPGPYETSPQKAATSKMLDLLQGDTPEARNMQAALDLVEKHGMKGRVVARQGRRAEEILAEARAGRYDLVGTGSIYGPRGLGQLGSIDVAAEVAEHLQVPILIARTRATATPTR
jgi:nucleotide-binding universal stress UspA family protein